MTTKAFDEMQTLKKYRGDFKITQKVIALFFAELPKVQKKINQAYEEKKIKNLQASLHKLYGSLSFVSAPELKAVTASFYTTVQTCSPEKLHQSKAILKKFNTAVSKLLAYKKDAQKHASS